MTDVPDFPIRNAWGSEATALVMDYISGHEKYVLLDAYSEYASFSSQVWLTPATARELAAWLTDAADKIEAEEAEDKERIARRMGAKP